MFIFLELRKEHNRLSRQDSMLIALLTYSPYAEPQRNDIATQRLNDNHGSRHPIPAGGWIN